MRIHRRAAALVAVALLAVSFATATPAGAAPLDPDPSVQAIIRNGLSLTTLGSCGTVRLQYRGTSTTDPTLLSRLPINLYVSEPSRGLARTFVGTVTNANLTSSVLSNALFDVAPSGRGPGLQVSVEWAGGTETVQTESYVDNCSGNFFPVPPTRLLDTRTGQGATGLPAPVAAGTSIVVDPIASGAVPPVGVTALVLNVTVVEPQTAGYVTVYPCGQEPPNASNINFAAGQTAPNLVLVDLVGFPATGTVCIFSSTQAHVLADVTGFFLANGLSSAGTRLNLLPSPQRVLDTRGATKIAAGTIRRVQMTGLSGIPASGVSSVSMNITAVNGAGPGFLTAFPCDQTQPNASNVNYIATRAVPNAAIVGLSADGALCVFASETVDVLIDVNGYTAATGTLYLPNAPTRLFDSRLDRLPSATVARKLNGGETFRFTGIGAGSILALNVTAIDEEGGGFITVYPCDQGLPNASNLNFQAGEAIANTVLAKADSSGVICLFSTTRINFIIDLNGLSL